MDLAHVPVGPEAAIDLKLEGGAVKLIVGYKGADADVQLVGALKPKAFVEKLKVMIPGQIDDAIFDLILAQMEK